MKKSTVKSSGAAMRRIRLAVCLGSLMLISACAPVANNSIQSSAQNGGEKKYGKEEISQRHQVASDSSPSKDNVTNVMPQPVSQPTAQQSMQKVDCSTLPSAHRDIYFKSPANDNEKVATVKVGATGYGAPPKNYYPEGQRRLMTMRASKIDAYRALAEIVGGLHVWGGSAIGDMVIERDRYRVFVDSFVRGAHVLSVEAMEDNTYKTIVEMEVDQRFLNHVMTFIDPAADRFCYEQEADGSMSYFGYSVAPSFYYSE